MEQCVKEMPSFLSEWQKKISPGNRITHLAAGDGTQRSGKHLFRIG